MAHIADSVLARGLPLKEARAMVGDALLLRGDAADVGVRVARVEERASTPSMVQFSLVLRGPAEPLVPQGTYLFTHAHAGDYAFLVTPIGRWEGGFEYEACFSHAA